MADSGNKLWSISRGRKKSVASFGTTVSGSHSDACDRSTIHGTGGSVQFKCIPMLFRESDYRLSLRSAWRCGMAGAACYRGIAASNRLSRLTDWVKVHSRHHQPRSCAAAPLRQAHFEMRSARKPLRALFSQERKRRLALPFFGGGTRPQSCKCTNSKL